MTIMNLFGKKSSKTPASPSSPYPEFHEIPLNYHLPNGWRAESLRYQDGSSAAVMGFRHKDGEQTCVAGFNLYREGADLPGIMDRNAAAFENLPWREKNTILSGLEGVASLAVDSHEQNRQSRARAAARAATR